MTLSVQCVTLASSPTCEKESEVRSEKDSEEEETYPVLPQPRTT